MNIYKPPKLSPYLFSVLNAGRKNNGEKTSPQRSGKIITPTD